MTDSKYVTVFGSDPAFGDLDIIEISWLPPDTFYIFNNNMIASSWTYFDWKWRFFVAEQRWLMERDLDAIVAAAEQRLGLR